MNFNISIDHVGNVSAQIEYSQLSPRWKFPSPYHSHTFTSDDGATIDIIMIDTIDLSGLAAVQDDHAEGYFDPLPLKLRNKATDDQWTWIENTIKASTSDYVLVVGHYPVYSVCEHGNTATLVSNLRPLLLEAGAHYLCGHDHCMEHLVEPAATTNYFLSGMGAYCCYRPTQIDNVPADSLKWYAALDTVSRGTTAGFSSFAVTKESMVVTYYDQDGEVLYTAPAIAPRSAAERSKQ